VPVDEAVHDRPVLEHEQRAERRDARKNTSDLRPSTPAATPLSSVVRISGAASCAPSLALCALSTPTSLNQPWIWSSALLAFAEMSPDWADMPPKTRQKISTPMVTSPSRTRIAPATRGTPWRSNRPTAVPATRAQHRGEDHRHDDRRGLAEQPDEPDDDQHEADQQPQRETEVPDPRRRRN
jgi:hypothetical protein